MGIKMRKAIFFSLDALIAIAIILLLIILTYPTIKYSKQDTQIQYDLMSSLSSLKIGEINNPNVQSMLSNNIITNTNKSILEQIGEFYVNNVSLAKSLANSVLSKINISKNVGIWFGETLIASINETPIETAKNIETTRQTISGITKGNQTIGFVAKSWLKKIKSKRTTFVMKGDLMCGKWATYSWGEYCGVTPTSVYYRFKIPENATIEKAVWLFEPAWVGQSVTLFVNNYVVYNGVVNYFTIINITNRTQIGNNTAWLTSAWAGEDGASHIAVQYSTPDLQTFNYEEFYPLHPMSTTAILYQEKSLFIPNPITLINVSINTTKKTQLSFRKGAKNFTIGTKDPVNSRVIFTNAEISNALNSNGLNYSNLSSEYFFFVIKIGIGTTTSAFLGENSYIQIQSEKPEIPFGAIDITNEIKIKEQSNFWTDTFYRDLVWEFNLPRNSIPIVADWKLGWLTSGTSAQKATANNIILYNSPPDPFINAFGRFGYTPAKANGLFQEGKNNFTLHFGNEYGVSNTSSYAMLTYAIKNFVNYGSAFEKAQGGKKNIEFENGFSKEFIIGNSTDIWDPEIDAIDESVERLLAQLDSDSNGKMDLILDEDNFEIEKLDISKVPYLWSTEVQIRIWN